MNIFIARQPILNRKKEVIGYELFFRNGLNNYFPRIEFNKATKDVITNSLFEFGINNIVQEKKTFINFTKELIEKGIPHLLSPKIIVIEILEDIEPDKNFIKELKILKSKGFKIAIDDFVFQKNLIPLIEFADILKIDFLRIKAINDRKKIIKEFNRPNLKFLAEKLETQEDFEISFQLGYSFFQGYFFTKPQVIEGRGIPKNKIIFFELLQEATKEFLDYNKINKILKKDIALPVKLLRYINSPFFGFKYKIESIKHALALLGENEIKKWVSLLALSEMVEKKQNETIKLSLIRGKLFELISKNSPLLKPYSEKLFFTGILSTLDAILKKPMKEICEELSISDDIKTALIGGKNILSEILNLAKSLESANWMGIDKYSKKFKIDQNLLFKSYLKSIKWAESLLSY